MKKNHAVEGLIKNIEKRLENIERVPIDNLKEYLKAFFPISTLTEENDLGDQYFRTEYPVLGLFTTINLNYIKQEVRSLELSSFPNTVTDILRIEELTNMLYDTLKDHTIGQGRFNEMDSNQCANGNWSGKLWLDYQSAAIAHLRLEKGYVSLTIINSQSE